MIQIILALVCVVFGVILTAFLLMSINGSAEISAPLELTLPWAVLSFLAFGFGLTGSISSLRRTRFWLAVFGPIFIAVWAVLAIQINLLGTQPESEPADLSFALFMIVLAVLSLAFVAASKKDFLSEMIKENAHAK
jgi:uncharacterized membrane protein YwzB